MTDFQGKTDIEFYATEGPKTFLLSCNPCFGTGRQVTCMDDDLAPLEYSDRNCWVCAGRGVVRFETDDVPLAHPSCKGTGRQWWKTPASGIFNGRPIEEPGYCRGCRGNGIIALTGTIRNLSGDKHFDKMFDYFVDVEHHPGNLPRYEFWEMMRTKYPNMVIEQRAKPKTPQITGQTE